MSSRAKTVRDALASLMVSEFNNITLNLRPTVKSSWMPSVILRDLEETYPNGIVWVTGGNPGLQSNTSRSNMARNEQLVAVGYQRKLNAQIGSAELELEIETSLEHVERMLMVVKHLDMTDNYGYSWSQSNPELDDYGKPYHYLLAREASTFESYFNITYINTIIRSE